MELFKRAFDVVLEQDDELESGKDLAPEPKTDREAMAQKLDTSKPEDFDIPGGVTNVDHIKEKQKGTLKEWITKIDQFIEFLNSPTDSSVQSQLHSARCETMFEDIARSEKKKISRLAAELSSLSESFKGYLISSND